jgi:hypothetical protein
VNRLRVFQFPQSKEEESETLSQVGMLVMITGRETVCWKPFKIVRFRELLPIETERGARDMNRGS